MLHNNFEIRVLVKGRPITEYAHNGQVFLEGRHGSNFEVEFLNRSSTRVEAVISVDGLSVIDGKEAGITSAGYVVDANSSVSIPGWKLNNEQVAAFVFAGKGKSYATQSSGSDRNNGVIGALVFAEKASLYKPTYGVNPFIGAHGGLIGGSLLSMQPRKFMSVTLENTRPKGICESYSASATMNSTQASKVIPTLSAVEQNLGTGFGAATEFETTEIKFTRGDMAAMVIMYYDDSRGLRARGIELVKPSRQRIAKANTPQAFPALNCVPPAGWTG